MKLLPTIVAVSSIACGLAQSLSLAPSTDSVCPIECGLGQSELLKMVNDEFPTILSKLEKKHTLLPCGMPINEILSTLHEKPSPDGNLPEKEKPKDIQVPFVQVSNPEDVVSAINALLKTNPTTIIDKLIAKKPSTLTTALKTICKKLGSAFETAELVDAPIDIERLEKQLKQLKKKGDKVDILDLISLILENLMPLESDKHRLYRTLKFFRNAVKKDCGLRNIFKRLVSSEDLPNVESMPFKKLIKKIVKHKPSTHLAKALTEGDCGCFDFVDSTVQISKVEIPDETPVSDALDSVPETISSKTISKYPSKKPKTLGEALKIISKRLGNAFQDTGLDLPFDIKRFNTDVQSAARRNGGNLPRYIFIGHMIKNMQPSNPIEAFRTLKLFRNVVKHNPETAAIFSRLIPLKVASKIPKMKSKDVVKEIVTYNPESHIARSLTGRPTLSGTGHNHKKGGAFGLGAIAHNPENHKKIVANRKPLVLPIDAYPGDSPSSTPKYTQTTGKPGATKIGTTVIGPKKPIGKIGTTVIDPKKGHPLHPRIGTVTDPKRGHSTGKPGASKPVASKPAAPKPAASKPAASKIGTETVKKGSAGAKKPAVASTPATTAASASAQKSASTAATTAPASGSDVANGASGVAKSSGAKSGAIKTGGIKPARDQSDGSSSSGGSLSGGSSSSSSSSGGSSSGGSSSSGSLSSSSSAGSSKSGDSESNGSSWSEVSTWTEEYTETVTWEE